MIDDGRLLDAAEVAEVLGVPRSWVYAEARAGRLPCVRLGRYTRFAPASIEAFIAGLERGPVLSAPPRYRQPRDR